jgi:hypothetical protein
MESNNTIRYAWVRSMQKILKYGVDNFSLDFPFYGQPLRLLLAVARPGTKVVVESSGELSTYFWYLFCVESVPHFLRISGTHFA